MLSLGRKSVVPSDNEFANSYTSSSRIKFGKDMVRSLSCLGARGTVGIYHTNIYGGDVTRGTFRIADGVCQNKAT